MKRLLIILTLAGLPCAPFAQTRLTLDACIEQAEANNKALAAADRQLAAAQFDFRSARANFFPSFSATGTGLYSTAARCPCWVSTGCPRAVRRSSLA